MNIKDSRGGSVPCVVICVCPLFGHIFQTFEMAGSFSESGYRVVYLGLSKFESTVVENGFEFVNVEVEDGFKELPDGSKLFMGSLLSAYKGARLVKDIARRTRVLIGKALDDLGPCLFLVDGLVSAVASFPAEERDIPVVKYDAALISRPRNWLNPPLHSYRMPAGSLWNRFGIWRDWNRDFGLAGFVRTFINRRWGVRSLREEDSKRVPEPSGAKHPTAKLSTRALALPTEEGELYLGPCVHRKRKAIPFDLEAFDDGRPIVLCSLGSMTDRYDFLEPFFRKIYRIFSRRSEWRLILQADLPDGVVANWGESENIVVEKWVPQLLVLERTKLMISHGGYGTLRECVVAGVPLLAFPLALDHPGVSTRVVYHGLGLRGSVRESSEEDIERMVEEALSNSMYRDNVLKLREGMREMNELQNGMETLKAIADEFRGRPKEMRETEGASHFATKVV